ncbi:hypothetical protein C8J55DRAFT_488182 [Lentinula edodes]|uniref:MYND-type domain-containing protein n=1 Tax=Lentinula lateritia TaxID=40482 RepID=A0A9W9DTX8_9AGAR|nr:hypothetical protein C8J55DRAFT_488182 [Lentinula edodes]
MANKDPMQNTALKFIQCITSPPPVIDASRPLAPEVVEALDALHSMTRKLTEISSFQTRLRLVDPNWSSIWMWLKALLQPLDAFHDPQSRISALTFDTWSRCILQVFSFMNSILIPRRTPVAEIHLFVTKLAESPESLPIFGKIWVFSFALRWPLPVHQATTQFLVVFSQIINGSHSGDAFRVAVCDACPTLTGSRILSTWSTAILDFPRWPVSSDSDCRSLMGNQALMLAATAMFIQPLPAIQEVDVLLTHMRKLWNRCLDVSPFSRDNGFGMNLLLSLEYIARFFLHFVSGGSKWMVKALDCGLLYLLAKTSAWLVLTFRRSTHSIYIVFEDIMHQLLLNVIYMPVVRRVRRNMFKVRGRDLEDYLGFGRFRELWSNLESEVYGVDACFYRTICFEKSLETVCSNESCPRKSLPGERSKLCGACRVTAYCSKSCQKRDWQAGHRISCPKICKKQSILNLEQQPMCLSGLDKFQLLFRVLIQAKSCCTEIRQHIHTQELTSSRIVIEFDLTVYPWKWIVLNQSSSARLGFLLGDFPKEQDTVIGLISPSTDIHSDYTAHPVCRATLLDPTHHLEYKWLGSQRPTLQDFANSEEDEEANDKFKTKPWSACEKCLARRLFRMNASFTPQARLRIIRASGYVLLGYYSHRFNVIASSTRGFLHATETGGPFHSQGKDFTFDSLKRKPSPTSGIGKEFRGRRVLEPPAQIQVIIAPKSSNHADDSHLRDHDPSFQGARELQW